MLQFAEDASPFQCKDIVKAELEINRLKEENKKLQARVKDADRYLTHLKDLYKDLLKKSKRNKLGLSWGSTRLRQVTLS